MRYAPPSRSMASFLHAIKSLVRQPDSQLVRFNNFNFKIHPSDQQIEEEAYDNITKGRYYPVRIGDVIKDKYQVLGKLGYGLGSTVWLANELSMQGPNGEHHCLVYEPMLESAQELLRRNPSDISGFNILLGIDDKSILQKFIKAEQERPSPRKDVRGYTVYASRAFDSPSGKSIGEPLLSDFGSAVSGDVEHDEDVQPNVYRAPEIWDLFEGKHLFYGRDPKEEKYMTRAHLAEMIALMGPPPPELLKVGKRTAEFFDKDGGWIAEVPVPARTSLEESEENLEGSNKEAFLQFMRKMVQWRPEGRQTASQLLKDDWLNGRSSLPRNRTRPPATNSRENQMIKVVKEHRMRHCNKRRTRNGTGEKTIVKLKAQKAAAIRGRKAVIERK
ncbi:MAG: hypothetical protein Q9210_003816 [Variospora velana]